MLLLNYGQIFGKLLKTMNLTNIIRDFDMHASIKEIISKRLNINCGNPILPLPQLNNDEKSKLITDVKKLNLIDFN